MLWLARLGVKKTGSTTTGSSVVLSGLSFFIKCQKWTFGATLEVKVTKFGTKSDLIVPFQQSFFLSRKNHFGAFWTILVGKMLKFVQKQGLASPFLRFPVDGNRRWVGLSTLSEERKLVR